MNKNTSKKVLSEKILEVDKSKWEVLYKASKNFIKQYQEHERIVTDIINGRKESLYNPEKEFFLNLSQEEKKINKVASFYHDLLAYEKIIDEFFKRTMKMGFVFPDGDIVIAPDELAEELYGQVKNSAKKGHSTLGFVQSWIKNNSKPKIGIEGLHDDKKMQEKLQNSLNSKKEYYKIALERTHVYEVDEKQLSKQVYKIKIVDQSNNNEPKSVMWESKGQNSNKKNGTYIKAKAKNATEIETEYWLLQGNGGQLSEGYLNWVLDGAIDKKFKDGNIPKQIKDSGSQIEETIYAFWRQYVKNKKDNIKAIVRGDIRLSDFFGGTNLTHISVKGGHNGFGLESPLQFFHFAVMISAIGEKSPDKYPEELEFSEKTIDTFSQSVKEKAKKASKETIKKEIKKTKKK